MLAAEPLHPTVHGFPAEPPKRAGVVAKIRLSRRDRWRVELGEHRYRDNLSISRISSISTTARTYRLVGQFS